MAQRKEFRIEIRIESEIEIAARSYPVAIFVIGDVRTAPGKTKQSKTVDSGESTV